jgi:outer membrane protein OmpA-like peptidoglycan-associated protein
VPPIVHEVLRSSGQRLAPETRAFMEPRFGRDFSQVRVHADARAAASARAVNALAYTVGTSIVFGQGRYAPGNSQGRRLLAHELSHVLQQSGGPAPDFTIKDDFHQEAEAEAISNRVNSAPPFRLPGPLIQPGRGSRLQRKVAVNDPKGKPANAPSGETNEKIVKDYITQLCSGFTVTAGQVVPTSASFCAKAASSSTPEACGCLCFMHGLKDSTTGADITWTIVIDDTDWPHTDDATKTVTVHSPFSGVGFGSWAKGDKATPAHRTKQPNWLVLGHELCGHAQLFAKGTHPTGPAPTHGGRPSHDVTVGIENKIAAEHGIPAKDLRGLFADPHHGESLAKVTVAEFPVNSSKISALPSSQSHQLDIAEGFIKSAAVKMDVIGHTDQQGPSAAANTALSQNRAQNVKKELESRKIDAARFLAVKGVGSSECPASGDQPSCRKVDIFMFIMEGASETHK